MKERFRPEGSRELCFGIPSGYRLSDDLDRKSALPLDSKFLSIPGGWLPTLRKNWPSKEYTAIIVPIEADAGELI